MLPNRIRQLIHLRCHDGLSRMAAAERMYITDNAARNYTADAVKRTGCRNFYQVCMEYGRDLALLDSDEWSGWVVAPGWRMAHYIPDEKGDYTACGRFCPRLIQEIPDLPVLKCQTCMMIRAQIGA